MTAQGPILVPLDGSDLAERAIPVAVALARKAGAEVHLVHVHRPLTADPIYVEGLPVIDEHMHSRRREHEQAYLDGLRVRLAPGPPATARVIDGTVAAALAAYARTNGCQLVAMTTHGRGGLERAWLGSVADEMARVSSVPILLVRPEAGAAPPFRRILVPLDGSSLAEAILEHAVRIARFDPDAEVILLEVVPPIPAAVWVPQAVLAPDAANEEAMREREGLARQYVEAVALRLRSDGLRARARVARGGNVAATIRDTARAEGADLVALCTHGRSGLVRMALGSVADKVVRASETPVLLFRPPASPPAA